ncbi:MAG TPA: AMP-binding protein [Azospirillum sp.]|nr:AMP-binding protein [Azospirillum sp.]
MNLACLVEHNARTFPDRPALSLGTRLHATHATLAARVRALSHHLRVDRRLPAGTRVGLAMTNCPAFWEVLFAVWHAGLVAVPINPKLHGREIEFILGHSGAQLCFATADLVGSVVRFAAGLAADGGVVDVDSLEYRQARDADIQDQPPAPLAATDPAWLFYTSGTTGRPKGATLSHRNLRAMIDAYLTDIDRVAPADAMLHAAPQSHGSGLYGLVHVAMAANTIVPESGGFDPAEIASLLDHYSGLSLFAAPTMLNRLVSSPVFASAPLGNLKTIIYGGAPMYRADLARALALVGPRLAQIYGQGEAPMTITGLSKACHADTGHPRYEERLGSVGYARSGVEVRVVDEAGTPLDARRTGEVVVRGDVVMAGYWQDPDATAKTLRNGWLHTGDVGVLDEDGFLTLLDRSKDVIISGGSNVYPREVEEVLLRHPAIREVSVIGQPHPDWGEEVVACIVPRDGHTIDPADLDGLCLDHIARFKRPRVYLFLDGLPKNSTGKVLKTDLRRRIAGRDDLRRDA